MPTFAISSAGAVTRIAASTPRLSPRVKTRPQRIRRPSPRETRGAFGSFAGLGGFGIFTAFGGFGIATAFGAATAFMRGAFGGFATFAERCIRGRPERRRLGTNAIADSTKDGA